MKIENTFFKIAEMIPALERLLKAVPKNIYDSATEIRIRSGKPVIIETKHERYICGNHCVDTAEIHSCIKCFCDYSIYSFKRELSEGWITLKGGHRVGFSGTAYYVDKKIETINDISSLNIRIAREHKGISDVLFEMTAKNRNFKGLLIIGPPLSGKTTMLRDFCRNCGNNFKTALIDERNEISAVYKGESQHDIGINTDVLNCYSKENGIEHAIRVLSPEYVICDEIGNEIELINKMACSGVKFVFSVHCLDLEEALNNKVIESLLKSGIVNYISFVDKGENIGKLKGLWYLKYGEGIDSCNNGNNLLCNRNIDISRTENAGYSAKKIYCNA